MKIRFFIPGLFNSAGMERISTSLANMLQQEGFDCGFVVLSSNTSSFYPLNQGISIHSLNAGDNIKKHRLATAKKLKQYLVNENPDVLVNVDVSMIQISALTRLIYHGCRMITWEHFSFAANHSLLKRLQRYLAAMVSSRLVVLTQQDRKQYPFFLRKKVVVISNFTQINPQQLRCDMDNKVVISIGRMAIEKGFDALLKSWIKVHDACPDWTLKIIGGGDENYKSYIEILAQSLPFDQSVQVLPSTKDIVSQYTSASIYALPSSHEPFGLVLIEAKSFGLPIVSFDCPFGPREIVRDEVDGYLVTNGDTDLMAEKLIQLMQSHDKRTQFSAAALDDYHARWHQDRVKSQWIQLLTTYH